MGPIHAWEHNLLGKMFPTFCPMGPCMLTKDELPDPGNVQIQTRLNGQVMQDANTDDLVFSVPRLIEYYSQFYLLRPGDVTTTRTTHARRMISYCRSASRRSSPTGSVCTLAGSASTISIRSASTRVPTCCSPT